MKKYSLFSIVLLWGVMVLGQTDPFKPDLNIKAPEVSSLLKFLDTPVSYNTGLPNITVPIYTIQQGDITYPISVDYNSSGLNVNERAGWVGMGFSINQPQVTRIVKGIPDENSNGFFYENIFKVASGYCEENWVSAYNNSLSGQTDLESDEYRAILPNGENIRFYFNQERSTENPYGEIIQMPITKNKIELIVASNNLNGWRITDTNGFKYIYDMGNNTTSTTSYSVYDDLPVTDGMGKTNGNQTSWMLKTIVSPTNKELNFTYFSYVYTDCDLVGQRRDIAGFLLENTYPQTNYQKTYATNYLLESITGDFGYVDFIRDTNPRLDYQYGKKLNTIKITNNKGKKVNEYGFEYIYKTSPVPDRTIISCGTVHDSLDLTRRMFLDRIVVKDTASSSSSINKPFYKFNYNPTQLPHRFSYAVDWWGNYNGANDNQSMVPTRFRWNLLDPDRNVHGNYSQAGLLTEIIYPTGGSTQFEYENNRFLNDKLPQRIDFTCHHCGGSSGPIDGINLIPTVKTGIEFHSNENTYTSVVEHGGHLLTYEMLFNIGDNAIPFLAKTTPLVRLPLEVITDCETCVYPPSEDGESLPTDYSCSIHYTIMKGTDVVVNNALVSGNQHKDSELRFGTVDNTGIHLNSGEYKLIVTIYTGKNMIGDEQLFDPDENNVDISFNWKVYDPALVTKIGDKYDMPIGGHRIKSIKTFSDPSSLPLEKRYDYKDENGLESGFCNFRLANVFEFGELYYINSDSYYPLQFYHGQPVGYSYVTEKSVAGSQVQATSYKYQFFSNPNPESYGACYLFQNSYGHGLYPCVDDPNNGLLIENKIGNEKKIENFYAADNNTLNTKYIIGFNTSNRLEADHTSDVYGHPDYWFAKYNISNFYEQKPSSTKTTEFFGTGEVVTEVDYTYNTTTHLQLASQTTADSKGAVLETKYYYPQDDEMENEPFRDDLITANRIAAPLVTQTYRGGNKLSEQKTVYNDWGSSLLLPQYIQAAKGSNELETRLTFSHYDEKGNLLEAQKANGTPISYIWGYNKTQLVAKIENAANAEVETALGMSMTTANESNIATLRTLLPNAMVTTYTYIPLVGVSTITDPKGDVTTYIYDSFGRLKEVRDDDGNILGENEYHYRTQN